MTRELANILTIKANVDNQKLSDEDFRAFVKTITDMYSEDEVRRDDSWMHHPEIRNRLKPDWKLKNWDYSYYTDL